MAKRPVAIANYRQDGRSLVDIDSGAGGKVRRVFELYAYQLSPVKVPGYNSELVGRIAFVLQLARIRPNAKFVTG